MMPAASVTDVLQDYVGAIIARSIVNGSTVASGCDPDTMTESQVPAFLQALDAGVRTFINEPTRQQECTARLRSALQSSARPGTASTTSGSTVVQIAEEYDIVTARNHAKTLCDGLGSSASEQVKIATVVSELARNIVNYVGTGRIELQLITGPRRCIEIRAIDRGRGIPNLDEILSGRYRSKTGLGVGLLGTKRLMDEFDIDSGPGRGTSIVVRKYL